MIFTGIVSVNSKWAVHGMTIVLIWCFCRDPRETDNKI